VGSHRDETIAVKGREAAECRFAQRRGLLQHRIEHRPEVAGRGVDDAEYFGGCSLLRQRFARLGQEPRVLHCDHRLRRKVLQQRDLFVGESSNLASMGGDIAEQGAILAQRNHKQAANAGIEGGLLNRNRAT